MALLLNANDEVVLITYKYRLDVECRGKNLFDGWNVSKTFLGLTCKTSENMTIVLNGTKIGGLNVQSITSPNILLKAGTYTVSIKMISGSIEGITDGVYFGINRNTYSQRTAPGVFKIGDIGKRTFTLTGDTTLSSFDIAPSYGSPGAIFTNATFECQFELGTEATEYEPYTPPITTPLYLDSPLYSDDVLSYSGQKVTRGIKELILTGEEDWVYGRINEHNVFRAYLAIGAKTNNVEKCTHYIARYTNSDNSIYVASPTETGRVVIIDDRLSSVDDFKSYLAAQYANGTPVTVYYVLAEPETKAVEPVEIPTLNGTTVIDVDTEVKPSNMWIEYKSSTSEYNPITLRTTDNQVLYTADNEILQTRR